MTQSDNVQDERDQLWQLHHLALQLAQTLDLDQAMQIALHGAITIIGASGGWLTLTNQDGLTMRIVAVDAEIPTSYAMETLLESDVIVDLVQSGRMERYERLPDGFVPLTESETAEPILLLGLRGIEEAVGLIGLCGVAEEPLSDFQARLVNAVAELVSAYLVSVRRAARQIQAEQVRERMTNLLVHDIRSPLMATHASIEIARRAMADLPVHPFVGESLAAGVRSVRSVIDLTNDLLDVKRLQGDASGLVYRNVMLQPLIEEVMVQMQSLAHERSVAVRATVVPPELELQADSRLLRRVLVNLLANAIRFTAEASTIDISAKVVALSDERLLIVEDRGPGVPEADRERIFMPFIQAEGETERGSGLGLSLCREVALAHGGAVWVEDRPGGGSRFCLKLPIGPSVEQSIR
jgi:signal transduction histidine kinase